GYWPHYLLLSFYLFVGLAAFMIGISLVTQKNNKPSPLPTLRETYTGLQESKLIWILWGILAVIMAIIYLIFN
ncbi:MAG: Na+/glucose cotransporter, partial [bacterium]|nr:Na+/glucose cotransporter [bacterium]